MGLTVSVILHGLWNGMAISGVPLLNWYLIGAVPVFLLVGTICLRYRFKGERRVTQLMSESGYIPGVTEAVPGDGGRLSWRQRRARREWQSSVVRVLDGSWDIDSLYRTFNKETCLRI